MTGIRSSTPRVTFAGEPRDATYQSVLNRTREELANHYLKSTDLPGAEISYLLGYEDPNCFIRAYSTWTGTTPASARVALRTLH